jgi:presenilin-like A22 family membrane protease
MMLQYWMNSSKPFDYAQGIFRVGLEILFVIPYQRYGLMPQQKIRREEQIDLNQAVDDRLRSSVNVMMSSRHLAWRGFLNGVFTGLGGVVGATVGVAILLFVLQKVGGHVPLAGPYLEHLGQTIQQGKNGR